MWCVTQSHDSGETWRTCDASAMSSTDPRFSVHENARALDDGLLTREVSGFGIGSGWTLGEIVAAAGRPSLFVFLRHYG